MDKSTNLRSYALLRSRREKGKKGKKHEEKLRRANIAKLEENEAQKEEKKRQQACDVLARFVANARLAPAMGSKRLGWFNEQL